MVDSTPARALVVVVAAGRGGGFQWLLPCTSHCRILLHTAATTATTAVFFGNSASILILPGTLLVRTADGCYG